jgi:hypothetical protein
VSVSRLAALAFVTAIAMVSLTDITDGWSWLVGSLRLPCRVLRRGSELRRAGRDVGIFAGLLFFGLMLATVLVVFVAWGF